MSLRLVTLGGFRALQEESELSPLHGQPVRAALLVILAVEREIARDTVAELLWPDRETARASRALSQTVYQLRQDLGDEVVLTLGERLRVGEWVASDTAEFEIAVQDERWPEALERYGGHFLDGTRLVGTQPFEFWADRQRSRLERLYRLAQRGVIEALGEAGDLAGILASTRRWVELDPLEDEAHHALIEALARTGKRSEALSHFETYRRRLAVELEVEPLEQTIELIDRVRAGDPAVVGRSVAERPEGAPYGGEETEAALRERRGEPPARREPPDAAPALAVLPFLTLGPDDSQEYLSDGITEELINALARLRGLQVAARTSSFAFKGKQVDVREIGSRLSVRWVLEGSVRRMEDRIRINAQLVDATNGFHLWSESFDRRIGDLFAIQEEIARAIVDTLRVRLGALFEDGLIRPGTDRQDAYRHYLMGRHHWNQRVPDALRRSLACFGRAIEEDPEYGRAYAGLADAYIAMAQFQYVPPSEVNAQAEEAVRRAIELAPGLAEAHTSRAHILEVVHWDWRGSEESYRRAIRLNPGYATARAWYADLLTALGRHDESRAEIEKAEAIEPLSVPIKFQKGSQLYRARRYEEALAEFRGVIEMEPRYIPAYAFGGLAHVAAGRPEEAVARLIAAVGAVGPNPVLHPVLVHALGTAGRGEEAEPLLAEMDALAEERYVPPLGRALADAGLGRVDGAFEWMEAAFQERHGQLPFLSVDPAWDPVRGDPRFAAFVRRLGLESPVGGTFTTNGG